MRKPGLSRGHYQIRRPRERLSMPRARAVLFLLSQRLAEVKTKGHNSSPLTMGIQFCMLLVLLGATVYKG